MMNLLLLTLLTLHLTNGEVYTSTQDLTNIFTVERRLVAALAQYLAKTEQRLTRIRKYLREYEQVAADWGMDSTLKRHGTHQNGAPLTPIGEDVPLDQIGLQRLAENPIHAFHLMKRMTVDWKYIGEHPPSEDWRGVADLINENEPSASFLTLPTDEDLHGAAQALVRLQDVYQLNMTSLSRGNIWGVQSAAELTAQDCLYMGKHSFNLGLYGRSVEWFEEAYTLAGLENNSTVTQEQIMSFLNTASKAYEESQPETINIDNQSEFEQPKIQPRRKVYKLGEGLSLQDDSDNFQALCRGENIQSEAYFSSLTCYYERRPTGYFNLVPVKVELINHDPLLLVYRDIISEGEINTLQSLAKPLLARAMVQGTKGKGNTVSNTRTSKVAWLHESTHPLVDRLAQRISAVTGLSTDLEKEHAEMLQIANYGIGGHYNPHHDYLLADKKPEDLANNINPRELALGDRIATFMFYLSDVPRGGATAFPRLGTAVWPQKGSAAFWYNLNKSGVGNTLTLHGACPVVVGSKWVSNQWIRSAGQFLARPCGLSPEE